MRIVVSRVARERPARQSQHFVLLLFFGVRVVFLVDERGRRGVELLAARYQLRLRGLLHALLRLVPRRHGRSPDRASSLQY